MPYLFFFRSSTMTQLKNKEEKRTDLHAIEKRQANEKNAPTFRFSKNFCINSSGVILSVRNTTVVQLVFHHLASFKQKKSKISWRCDFPRSKTHVLTRKKLISDGLEKLKEDPVSSTANEN